MEKLLSIVGRENTNACGESAWLVKMITYFVSNGLTFFDGLAPNSLRYSCAQVIGVEGGACTFLLAPIKLFPVFDAKRENLTWTLLKVFCQVERGSSAASTFPPTDMRRLAGSNTTSYETRKSGPSSTQTGSSALTRCSQFFEVLHHLGGVALDQR